MFCSQCGNQLPDGAAFCNKCGAKQEMPVVSEVPAETVATAEAPTPAEAPAPAETPVETTTPVSQPEETTPASEAQPIPEAPIPQPVPVVPTPAQPGMPTPVTEKPKKEKKGVPFFVWVLLVIMIVAVVAVGLIFILGGKGKKSTGYPKYTDKSVTLTDETAFKLDGTSCEIEDMRSSDTNKDNTVHAYLNSDGELFFIDDNLKPVSIADEVTSFKMSYSGDYVAYLINDEEDYDNQTLYLYDVKKDNSVKIDTNVYPYGLVLSPNGKYVSYIKDYEGSSDNTLYLAGIGKEKQKIDKDGSYPIAINDNGKYLYFINSSDGSNIKLYCYNGKENLKIAKNVSDSFFFNESISELVFVRDGDGYFYTPSMSDPVKICSKSISGFYNGNEEAIEDYASGRYGVIYTKKSLKDSLFMAGGQVFWLNKTGTDSVKVCDSDMVAAIAADGKSLLALNKGALYKFNSFSENMDPKLVCQYEDDITYVIASDDLSQIYVVTEEDELYYVKSASKLERISNDFNYKTYRIAYNESAKMIYYVEDGDLYSAGKTAKSKKLVMEDSTNVMALGDGIVFAVDDEYTMYYVGKKEPIVIYEESDMDEADEEAPDEENW